MVEIIKRVEGERHKSETVTGAKVQVSYNDWGHLCVRVIQDMPAGAATGVEAIEPARQADTLFVFDAPTSDRIMQFCKKIHKNNGIPF